MFEDGDPLRPRPPREGNGWQGAVLPCFLRGVVRNPGLPTPLSGEGLARAGQRTRALLPGGGRGAAPPRPYAQTLPHTGYCHLSRPCGWAFPNLPHRQGPGETRCPHVPTALGGGWRPHRQGPGETRCPRMFASDGHAHGAQRQNENTCSWEGVEARQRRASTPKPSHARALFA